MGMFAWLKKETAAEALIARALVEFAEGDQRDALGDLMQGLIDLAEGTRASLVLGNLRTRLVTFNLIAPPAAIPMQSVLPASNPTPSPTK